ncbi:RluA family pseudouridine synthase [Ruminococcus flavefaciens]|uniref:RluA family pseudouridine synthase n=1 Tax=Ruminococcus flavefaciens TaxID=1265 RepID=UPI0026F37893|nr:RluA family pseudouridine synthase [Ruminococcus flavefaciens]MDD7516994.1 RluA family pseudouridine synthase [Ruminococcus flavefaciens]MDY5692351.1 RluA family pseudouridine synthase [Ruminococcus flavefaciens]
MKQIELTAEVERPVTLENFLVGKKGVSKRLLTKLKRQEGGITRNGVTIRSIDMVSAGDVIVLTLEDDSFLEPNGSLNVPVAFENDSLVVFNKPSGMPVHPSIRHQGDTLGNYFAYRYPELTFRSVNRLDRDTSGLCIIAKDALAAKLLQGNCKKVYYAAVHGEIPEKGTIDAPIARERESIILRCVREDGQRAVTHYKRLKMNDKYSLAEIDLETGRTHQIRVHFAHIGAPLAGDDLYGGLRNDISRQALHCGRLSFNDPLSGEPITVDSELPEDIKALF